MLVQLTSSPKPQRATRYARWPARWIYIASVQRLALFHEPWFEMRCYMTAWQCSSIAAWIMDKKDYFDQVS